MSPIALGLALLAALAHSLWNLLVARTRATEIATAIALVSGVVFFAPIAIWTWQVSTEAIPYIALSAVLELAYFILLARAYRSAELSVVYPLARGSAPIFVLLASGARSPLQVVGVVLVALGTVLVRGITQRGHRYDVLAGLLLGVCIASYTLVDQRGVRLANPTAYLEAVLLLPALLYAGFIIWRASPRVAIKAAQPAPMIAGILMFLAYAFTLTALQLAPASAVSAVRESSIVITVVLAAPLLREAVGAMRVSGAAVVVAGVAAVALG